MEKTVFTHIKTRTVSQDEVCFWYLGQVGFLLRTAIDTIAIDPYLTDSIDRQSTDPGFLRRYAPPITPHEGKVADLVLCTHDHQDHLDPESIRGMDNRKNRFAAPAPVVSSLAACGIPSERILPLRHLEPVAFGGGTLIPIAAAHDHLQQTDGNYHALSFLFQFDNGVTVFHGGDLVRCPELAATVRAYHPQIVMLPINGRCAYREAAGIVGNMSFTEALDFTEEVGANMILPLHYDLYPGNGENPAYFVDRIYQKHFPLKFHLCMPGEMVSFRGEDWA